MPDHEQAKINLSMASLLAADSAPSADDVAEAFANDMAKMSLKFGKENPAGFVPNNDLAARLSRLVAIKLHKHDVESETVFVALHNVMEAETRAVWGLSGGAYGYESAVEDFEIATSNACESMRERIAAYDA